MRREKQWSWLCLMLGAAATMGCASLPGVTSLMPGRAAKPNETLDAQLSMGRLSERQGDARTAGQIYQAVLTKQPQNQLALHRLGVLAAKTGEHDKAAEFFDAAARLGPPSAELLNDIGFNLLGTGRLQEAEAVFRQAIAADPQNRSARNNLGLVLGETRRYDESLAEFRRAGRSEAEAHANLAYAQTQAGDLGGAKSSYHRALTLDNELKPAAEALVQLARQPSSADEPDQPDPGQAPVSGAFTRRTRTGASTAQTKTLPELVQEGRTSDFIESATERDRASGRANAGRVSRETTGAARQAMHIRDAADDGHDSNPLAARRPGLAGTQSASIRTVTNGPSLLDTTVNGRSSREMRTAAAAGGSFVLSRVFRFPARVESAPATEIRRWATADEPAPNSADRAASRLSAELPNPAKLADAVVPPPARPSRWRRATLHQPLRNSSPVAPFQTPAPRAALKRLPHADETPTVAPFQTPAPRAAQQAAARVPPSDQPTPGSDAVFAAPNLFFSTATGPAAPSPWQAPTWTPDFGPLTAGTWPQAPTGGGTIIPPRPLTNLAP